MSVKPISIQLAYQGLASLQSLNPVLLPGQMVISTDPTAGTQIRIGDGSTPFNSLSPFGSGSSLISGNNLDISSGVIGQKSARTLYQKSY